MVAPPSCSASLNASVTRRAERGVEGGAIGPLDVRHGPGRVHHQVGQPPSGADQGAGAGIAGDQHQDALARRPGPLDPAALHGVDQLVVHGLRRPAQGHFAQRGEVLGLEEVVRRRLGGARQVDLARGQPLAQLLGRDVDQLDLVGVRQRPVRHRLAHPHAGDLPHHVDQALEVLDVERGPDVDAGAEQLLHVLPALGMARARRVGVGVFVEQQQARPAAQRRVEVELQQLVVAVLRPWRGAGPPGRRAAPRSRPGRGSRPGRPPRRTPSAARRRPALSIS